MAGNIRLYNTGGYVELQAPSSATNQTLVLPTDSIQPGLVHLAEETFSGVSEIIFDSVFSSTYDCYRIQGTIDGTVADQSLRFKLRASGSDSTGATDYKGAAYTSDMDGNLTASNLRTTGSTSGVIAATNTGMGSFEATYLRTETANDCMLGRSVTSGSGTVKTHALSFICNAATAHDGIRFLVPSGTIAGTIQIYGYRNS